jgi:hypothetical protein
MRIVGLREGDMRILIVASLGILMAAGACATASTPPAAGAEAGGGDLPIPQEWRPQVKKAEDLGREIYLLDKVSAIGTDELMKHVPDLRGAGLGGYLPVREADDNLRPKDSFMVTFFTKEDPPRISYQVRVPIRVHSVPEFEGFDPPKAGTPSFLSLVRARQAAIAALPPVSQPMNPVILPGSANGEKGILVYLLAGTTKHDTAVFGRHFRVLMPDQGTSPTYVMPLSKSVLEMSTRGPEGSKPEGLMVTHLVSDLPLETHVFVSLLFHLPVYVGTRTGVWRVDGDKIALISNRPPKGLH